MRLFWEGIRRLPKRGGTFTAEVLFGLIRNTQRGHKRASGAAHFPQNLRPSRLSLPHFEQRIFPRDSEPRSVCQKRECIQVQLSQPVTNRQRFEPYLSPFVAWDYRCGVIRGTA